MHEVLVKRLGGLSLSRKSVVMLTDRPDMTLDVYRGCKTTITEQQQHKKIYALSFSDSKQVPIYCYVDRESFQSSDGKARVRTQDRLATSCSIT